MHRGEKGLPMTGLSGGVVISISDGGSPVWENVNVLQLNPTILLMRGNWLHPQYIYALLAI